MARTLRDLEADGLVERRADPTDGRRTLVDLTGDGLRTLEDDRRRRQGWLTEALRDELTESERSELAQAVVLLRRIGELDTPF